MRNKDDKITVSIRFAARDIRVSSGMTTTNMSSPFRHAHDLGYLMHTRWLRRCMSNWTWMDFVFLYGMSPSNSEKPLPTSVIERIRENQANARMEQTPATAFPWAPVLPMPSARPHVAIGDFQIRTSVSSPPHAQLPSLSLPKYERTVICRLLALEIMHFRHIQCANHLASLKVRLKSDHAINGKVHDVHTVVLRSSITRMPNWFQELNAQPVIELGATRPFGDSQVTQFHDWVRNGLSDRLPLVIQPIPRSIHKTERHEIPQPVIRQPLQVPLSQPRWQDHHIYCVLPLRCETPKSSVLAEALFITSETRSHRIKLSAPSAKSGLIERMNRSFATSPISMEFETAQHSTPGFALFQSERIARPLSERPKRIEMTRLLTRDSRRELAVFATARSIDSPSWISRRSEPPNDVFKLPNNFLRLPPSIDLHIPNEHASYFLVNQHALPFILQTDVAPQDSRGGATSPTFTVQRAYGVQNENRTEPIELSKIVPTVQQETPILSIKPLSKSHAVLPRHTLGQRSRDDTNRTSSRSIAFRSQPMRSADHRIDLAHTNPFESHSANQPDADVKSGSLEDQVNIASTWRFAKITREIMLGLKPTNATSSSRHESNLHGAKRSTLIRDDRSINTSRPPVQREFAHPIIHRSPEAPSEFDAARSHSTENVSQVESPYPAKMLPSSAQGWSPADLQQLTDQVMNILDQRIVAHRERMGGV